MSDPVRFLWIEVEGFRGFRDKTRFDLDASVVILSGPNGTGKTSFCDAIQWLLLGDVSRFAALSTRRDTTYVDNIYRAGQPAIVSAGLKLNGREVQLTRTGLASPGHLEWNDGLTSYHGEEAEIRLRSGFGVPARVDFSNYLLRSAILQQDLIKTVLEDKPAERYRNLVSLLGLDEIQDFVQAAKERALRASEVGERARDNLRQAEARLQNATGRIEELQGRAARRPDIQSAIATLSGRLENVRFFDRELLVSRVSSSFEEALSSIQSFDTLTRRLLDRLSVLERRREELTNEAALLDEGVETIEEASENRRAARLELEVAEQAFAWVADRTDAIGALASQALPLLGDRCPVCGQGIVADQVRLKLQQIVAVSAQELNEARKTVEMARAKSRAAELTLDKITTHHQKMSEVDRRSAILTSEFESWQEDAAALYEKLAEGLGLDFPANDFNSTQALAQISDELRSTWSAFSQVSVDFAPSMLDLDLAGARSDVERLRQNVEINRDRARAASAFEEEAATLFRTATRAAAAVTSRRSSVLAPIVQDIFSRLDPHPMLKTLDFQFDVYYERGTARPILKDASGEFEANPILVLSSSQANVAALSCFLALGWASGASSAGFVMLDDPLQSMDDVNALGFADICRHLRSEKQLIISTHDRRLASLLTRKLAPRHAGQRTRVMNFRGWEVSGPVIDSELMESEQDIGSRRVLGFAAA
jgi:DNA repair exonuclease SbcCD ATPase subunit